MTQMLKWQEDFEGEVFSVFPNDAKNAKEKAIHRLDPIPIY